MDSILVFTQSTYTVIPTLPLGLFKNILVVKILNTSYTIYITRFNIKTTFCPQRVFMGFGCSQNEQPVFTCTAQVVGFCSGDTCVFCEMETKFLNYLY
jgi:hypothetical protein